MNASRRIFLRCFVLLSLTFFSSALFASTPQLLATWTYRVQPGMPYETRLTQVFGGLQSTQSISVRTVGNYCGLAISAIQYQAYPNGPLLSAFPLNLFSDFGIPEGSIHSLNIRFSQGIWAVADCSILVYGASNDVIPVPVGGVCTPDINPYGHSSACQCADGYSYDGRDGLCHRAAAALPWGASCDLDFGPACTAGTICRVPPGLPTRRGICS